MKTRLRNTMAELVALIILMPFGVLAQTQIINPHGLIDEDVEWDLGDYNYCRIGVVQTKRRIPVFFGGGDLNTYPIQYKYSGIVDRGKLFLNNGLESYDPVDWPSEPQWLEDKNAVQVFIPKGDLDDLSKHLFSDFHFPERLNDLMTTGFVDENVENLVILVHGWNLSGTPFQYGGAFETLWRNLTEALEGTSWGLARYHWSKDSATGSPLKGGNPSDERVDDNRPDSFFVASAEAAAIGDSHGRHLGKMLLTQHPKLKRVILMCHSAGTWVGYRTAKSLLIHNDTVEVELMLMDPYIPGEVVGGTPLTADRIRSLDGFGGDRITLHNYNSEDNALATFACIGDDPAGGLATTVAFGTSVHFGWSARHIEAAVHSRYHPEHFDLCEYGGHEGPILFVADTVASYLGHPSEGWSSEWNDKYGFGNSLFTKWKLHEEIPVVSIEDELPWQTHERVAQEWQELGFADITVEDVQSYGVSKYDWYEIRDGQLTALSWSLENGEYSVGTRGLGLYLPGFEPPPTSSGGYTSSDVMQYSNGHRVAMAPSSVTESARICIPDHPGFGISHLDQKGLDLRDPATGAMLAVFTIEGWYNPLPPNDTLDEGFTLMCKASNGTLGTAGPFLGWRLWVTDGGKTLQFHYGDYNQNSNPGETRIQARNIFTQDDVRQWVHIAVTVYPGLGTAFMYKNGEEQMVETPVFDAMSIHHAEGYPFVFGAIPVTNEAPCEIHGDLRNWSIWGYDRPIGTIRNTEWVRGDEGNLIAHWRFTDFDDEGKVLDSAWYDNHLHAGMWNQSMRGTSMTHAEWVATCTAVFAEGDRLPDVVTSGTAADSTTLPDPTLHFTLNGAELLGDKLVDGIGGIRFDAEDSAGRLGNAVGYDGTVAGAFFINDTSRLKPAYLALRTHETRLRFNHEPWALGMWVQIPEGSMSDGDQFVVAFVSHMGARDNKLSLEIEGNGTVGSGYGGLYINGGDVGDAGWHHLMITVNYVDWTNEANRRFELTLYVDGVSVGTQSKQNSSLLIAGSDHELHIGGHPKHQQWFYGNVDEIMLWQNTEITAAQVSAYYNSQTP